MNSMVNLFTDNIGQSMRDLVAQAKDQLTLIAPFIKQSALDRLLAVVGTSVNLTIFTRWRIDEIVSGACDLSVFDTMSARAGSRLLLHPRLHAKVILIDDATAVLGSANVTEAGLAFGDRPNVEIMGELRPVPNRMFLFVRQLERTSVPATAELRRQLEEAARASPLPPTYPAIEIPAVATGMLPRLFPSFRSPDRLLEGYRSVKAFRDPETRAAVLDDLEALSLPDDLDEKEFTARIGVALLTFETIRALDQFVARPRFFGEMVDWLKSREGFQGQEADDRKRYLQTLIRWLIHFLPRRYKLEQPGYSELFGRVDNAGDV